MRVLPPRGGSDLYQRVLGSSPRPVLIKISDKKRGEKRREKNLILKRVPWRKTSEEEEGKRKRNWSVMLRAVGFEQSRLKRKRTSAAACTQSNSGGSSSGN